MTGDGAAEASDGDTISGDGGGKTGMDDMSDAAGGCVGGTAGGGGGVTFTSTS